MSSWNNCPKWPLTSDLYILYYPWIIIFLSAFFLSIQRVVYFILNQCQKKKQLSAIKILHFCQLTLQDQTTWKSKMHPRIFSGKTNLFKHCNNCECCPVPLFIVRSLWFTHSFYSTNLSVMLFNQIRSEISLFTMRTALMTWNKLPETFFFLSWRAFKVGRLTFSRVLRLKCEEKKHIFKQSID